MKTMLQIAIVAAAFFAGTLFADSQKDASAVKVNPAQAMLEDEQDDTDVLAIPLDSSEIEDKQDEARLKEIEKNLNASSVQK